MKFLVVATPKVPAPPEMLPAMIDAAEQWHQRYEDKFDSFGLFPAGGGFAVADVSDAAELQKMILEMPFAPFSEHLIKPVVDGRTGWDQARTAVAALAGSA